MTDDSPEVKEFLERFEREVFPMVKSSVMTIGILSREPDAKMCLEVGASILLEKPLIMVVEKGTYIPLKLRKLATEIVVVEFPLSERDKELTQAAVTRVTDMLGRRKQ